MDTVAPSEWALREGGIKGAGLCRLNQQTYPVYLDLDPKWTFLLSKKGLFGLSHSFLAGTYRP